MNRGGFVNASRILTSVLAPLERRCLLWLAARMPSAIHSDHLTALAAVAMLGAGLCYWIARWNTLALIGCIAFLALNWFGDSLDGTLARVRGHERPRYGFYIDHIVDAFGMLFLVGGLALSGFMSPPIAWGILLSYYLLSIEVYLATYTLHTFRISYWNLGPTELRLILAIGNLALLFHPTATIAGRSYLLFDVGGVIAIAGLWLTILASFATNARALARAEPRPR